MVSKKRGGQVLPRGAWSLGLLLTAVCIGAAVTTRVGLLLGALLIGMLIIAILSLWSPMTTPFLLVSVTALVGLLVIEYPYKPYIIWFVVAGAVVCLIKSLFERPISQSVRYLIWWGGIALAIKLSLLMYSSNLYDSAEQAIKLALLVGLTAVVAQTLSGQHYRQLLLGHLVIHVALLGYILICIGVVMRSLGWAAFGSLVSKPLIDALTVGANTLAPSLLLLSCVTYFLGLRAGVSRVRTISTAMIVLSGIAIFGLASRTTLVVAICVVGVAVFAKLYKPVNSSWVLIPSLLLGFVSFAGTLPVDVSILRGRYGLWAIGRWVFSEHLFTGIGDGAWYEYLGRSTLSDSVLLNPFTGELLRGGVHNVFLQAGLEQGLWGILLIILFVFVVKTRRKWSLVNVLLLVFAVRGITEANGMFFGQFDNVTVVLSWLYLGLGISLDANGETGVVVHEGTTSHTSVTAA